MPETDTWIGLFDGSSEVSEFIREPGESACGGHTNRIPLSNNSTDKLPRSFEERTFNAAFDSALYRETGSFVGFASLVLSRFQATTSSSENCKGKIGFLGQCLTSLDTYTSSS